jgi:hypothetical protein
MRRLTALLCLCLCCLLLAGCSILGERKPAETAAPSAAPGDAQLPDESAEPTPTPLESLYYDYSDYDNVLNDTCTRFAETMGGDYLTYGLVDLDGDGVLELLVKEGTCEADFIWQVYTIGETGAKSIGAFGGSHSVLFTNDEPGVLCLHGQMGVEEIERITYDGQYISSSIIQSRELAPGEDYSEPGTRVPIALITDSSLIPTM